MSIKEIKLAAFMVGFGFGVGTLMLGSPGCSSSTRAKMGAYVTGEKATITVGVGNEIRVFQSTGKVFSEEGSDGYYFVSKDSGKLVEVAPNLVIEYK